MLHSARRMGSTVSTGRFHWQRPDSDISPEGIGPVLLKLTDASPEREGSDPRELTLPSVTADRVAAIERDAFAKGYVQGERAGEEAAGVRVAERLDRLTAAIDEVVVLRNEMLRQSERDIVRLSIAIAERVIRREASVDPDLLIVMARVAIERLGENVKAAIHLHPDDVPRGRSDEAGSAITVVPDLNIPRGGCIVRSSIGTIDVGLDSQIRELSRELLGDEPGDEGRRDDVHQLR